VVAAIPFKMPLDETASLAAGEREVWLTRASGELGDCST